MAENDNLVEFLAIVDVDDKSLKATEKKVEAAGERSGAGFSEGFGKSIKLNLAAKLATAVGVIGTALFGKASIDAAIEAERAVQSFNNALGRTGQFTQQASQRFQEFADSLELSTGQTAEDVLGVATQIQNIAQLSVPQLERTTKVALDLSKALGIDLQQAATLVGKAANGQVAAFGRLGIQIQKGRTDAETFENALRILDQRFGGASAAALNTYAGATQNFSNAIGKIPEEFGKLTTSSPKLIALINALAGEFSRIAGGIAELGRTSNFTDRLTQSFVTLGGVLINFVVRPLEFVGRVGETVFRALQVSIQQVVLNVARLGNALGTVLGAVGAIDKKTQENLRNFRDSAAETLTEFQTKGIEAFSSITDDTVTQGFRDSFGRISSAVDAAQGKIEQLPTKFAQVVEQTQVEADKFGPIINSSLVSAVTAGVSRIGAALVKGGDAFSDFKNTIFSIFGDLAIQLGQLLIAKGLAIEALQKSLATLSGGAAIAAGLGLIALGGALKAVGGGSLSAPATVGPAAGESAVVPPDTPALEDDAVDGSRSRVTVNIQGDVLDSRETGLRIVEILQDAFDTDGARVVTA
jgi:uncharacterized phage infection (PIP) family protein YhgE